MCQTLPFSLSPSLVSRHLAYSEVRLLIARAPLAEGYAPYLYHRLAGAGAVRPASHLAHPQLLRRLGLQHVFHYYSPYPRGGKRRCRQIHHPKRCRRNRLIRPSPLPLILGELLLLLQLYQIIAISVTFCTPRRRNTLTTKRAGAPPQGPQPL